MFEVVVNTAWPARKASTCSNRSCQAESPVPALLALDPLALVLADAPAPALPAGRFCPHQRERSKCKECEARAET